jgi:hypothetical protein
MPRLDTKLEAEGAEFLVLGQLLLHRIPAFKAYSNLAGYDLIATNAGRGTSARIQVKSRWKTGAPGFLIKNFDCEFVVAVRLNRGRKGGGGVVAAPEFFVIPVDRVKSAVKPRGWSKAFFRDIENLDDLRDAWGLIASFLERR